MWVLRFIVFCFSLQLCQSTSKWWPQTTEKRWKVFGQESKTKFQTIEKGRSSEANIPASELNALRNFYDTTGGPEWNWTEIDDDDFAYGVAWNFTAANPNPCVDGWVGITCSDTVVDGYVHILSIALADCGLNGQLPSTLNDLPLMTKLDVASNSLNSTIPSTLYTMSNLTYLDLSANQFSSALPDNIDSLDQLKYFSVNYNIHMGSTIPVSIYNISTMEQLYLSFCSFEGTISPLISKLVNLRQLSMFSNFLHGPVPQALMCMPSLEAIMLQNNSLSGPLPECDEAVTSLTTLQMLHLEANELTGTIPTSYGDLFTSLKWLTLSNNKLHGMIPASIGKMAPLVYLQLNNNQLTGTLPEAVAALGNVTTFDLSYNHLKGTLPEVLWDNIQLQKLILTSNQFSGTISNNIGNPANTYGFKSRTITALQIDDNLFTGTLPHSISQLRLMQTMFVNNNRFSGNLDRVFNASIMYLLVNIDVSTNQLIGTIPEEIFKLELLLSFAAGSNCFSGSLPDNICHAAKLSTLALDGLMSADSCQNRFFPRWMHIDSYWTSHKMQGSIPTCLFTSLPYLSVLHLSGNGFAGAMPQLTYISENLTDLSLSGNNLKGDIPHVIQVKSWSKNLDLSYNKLGGVLVGDFPSYGPDASLSLEVNRLSGSIPQALKYARQISILTSNLFSCTANRNSLPVHDYDNQQFECGSNSVDGVLYAWMSLIGAMVLLLVVVWYCRHNYWRSLRTIVSQYLTVFTSISGNESTNGLTMLAQFLKQLRSCCNVLALIMFSVMLIINSVLSVHFNSYTHEYAWNIASVYLSGVAPAVMLLIVFVVLSIVVWMVVSYYLHRKPDTDANSTAIVDWSYSQFACLILIMLSNVALMVAVNIGYVVINKNYSFTVVQVTQLAVALFKVGWNNYIVRFLLSMSRYFNSINNEEIDKKDRDAQCTQGTLVVVLMIVLFNNLAAPFIAIALISRSCFYDVITTPPTMTISYQYRTCDSYSNNDEAADYCTHYIIADDIRSTTYLPPFDYDYQCCSTYISVYASIYIVMLIITTFVPLVQAACAYVLKSLNRDNVLFSVINRILPKLLRCDDAVVENIATARSSLSVLALWNSRVFDGALFIVQLINILAVMLTFGVVFPPIAVLCCITVLSVTWFAQLCIGRYVWLRSTDDGSSSTSSDRGYLLNRKMNHFSADSTFTVNPTTNSIDAEARFVYEHFYKSLWVIVPFAVLFFSFLLFDTLGDTEGWRIALVMPVTVVSLVLLAMIVGWALEKCCMEGSSGSSGSSGVVQSRYRISSEGSGRGSAAGVRLTLEYEGVEGATTATGLTEKLI